MVDMNEHVISSTEEVSTYQNLDIVDCAVTATILADFDYWQQTEEFYDIENNINSKANIIKGWVTPTAIVPHFIFVKGEEGVVSTTSSTSGNASVNNSQKAHHHQGRKGKKKSSYKHVPHCEKPPQIVAKRNARERRRVHAVNQAFVRLRNTIPFENKVHF